MGFVDLLKGAITLGGSFALDKARIRHDQAARRYKELVGDINASNQEMQILVAKLKTSVSRTKRSLRIAAHIIAPPCVTAHSAQSDPYSSLGDAEHSKYSIVEATKSAPNSSYLALGSAMAGTSAAILAWQGAQVVGIASTGTAMLGLHGVAASNAGWALFGGGSLATGGGGMALGHLILPGVGLAIAVGVGAVSTWREAGKVNQRCEEIESVNWSNGNVLAVARANLRNLRIAETQFVDADFRVRCAVDQACRRLRRFGWLSVLYRFLRHKVSGVYYTTEELIHVERLDEAVRAFFASMTVIQN